MNQRPIRFNIRAKLSLFIIVVAVLFAIILYIFIIPLIEQEKRAEREGTLRAVVESAVSLMKFYEDGIRTYRWESDPTFPKTREEAQRQVLGYLREVRYSEDEHIFILDSSVHMVMHPLKPELEGQNMADIRAPDGSLPFEQMAFQAQLKNNVFISYDWLSKWSQSINEPQTTYAQYFYPWGWVVCSSLYTQDIDDVVHTLTLRLTLYFSIGLMVVWGILYFTGLLLINPILLLAKQVRDAEKHPSETAINAIAVHSNDEISDLADAFRHTLDSQQQATSQLKVSEARFRGFAENGADWFWEMDENLKFTYVAGRVYQVTGLRPEQIVGKTRMEIPTANKDLVSSRLQEQVRKLEQKESFSDFEIPWQRPDNEIRIITLSGKPVYNKKGKFEGYRGVGRDITKRRQLEEQVRRSQKMEAVGQLTSGIAHDFNNVLGIIQGNLEILKDTAALDKTCSDRIEKAQKGLDRGANITRKLLSFSRKDAQRVSLTSVNSFIENLKDLIAKSLTVSITVKTELAENLWLVAIDPGDLEDALLNLALNARDAMPDGGALTIQTANKRLGAKYVQKNPSAEIGDFVQISVKDTGSGIPENVLSKVLDPFFTTKEQGKGTGLGLSMVYGFVQRSGGYLKIQSEIGQGTNIQLYLPRIQTPVQKETSEIDPSKQLPTGSETILVVEDETDLRDVAVSYLQNLGYTTRTATNGSEALKIIKNGEIIDLVFSDVVMPGGLDGFQLARDIHADKPSLKILLTSGYTKSQDGFAHQDGDFLNGLADRVLSKPYSKIQLAVALRNILDQDEKF